MTLAEQCIDALTHGTPTLDETKQEYERQLAELATKEETLTEEYCLHTAEYKKQAEEVREAEKARTNAYYALSEEENNLKEVRRQVRQVKDLLGGVHKRSREHIVSILSANTKFSETDAMLQYAQLIVPGTVSMDELKDKTVVSFTTTEHTIEDTSTGNSWGTFCARKVEVTIVHDGFTRHASMVATPLYKTGNIIACPEAEYTDSTTPGKDRYTHPHIQPSGSCCLGNAAEMLLSTFKKKNILELILTACKFLCSYDGVNPYRPMAKFINPAQPPGYRHVSPWQRADAWCVACNDVSKAEQCTHMKPARPKLAGVHTCDAAALLRMCPSCGDNVGTHSGTGWCTGCMNSLLKFSFTSLKSQSRLRGFIGRTNGYS